MKKRLIALFTAAAVACTSTTAYAHDSDVFGGKYTNLTKANFFVRIHSSAENDVFSFYDVYQYGEEWNGISSNVDLYVVKADGESVVTNPNQINVFGVDPVVGDNLVFWGRTVPYDKYGEIPDDGNNKERLNGDWIYSRIEINTSEKAEYSYYYYYKSMTEVYINAKKVFLHELGHALKLSHPVQNSGYSMHDYDGYPKAIMIDGKLDDPRDRPEFVSLTITEHDKSCLIAKWGK